MQDHLRDSAEMHVKGAPVVENNSNQPASGTPYADNIYMQHSNVVLIFDGDLSEDAKLAVRKSGNVGQITDCGDYTFKEGTITADDPATRFVEREGDLYFGTSVAEEKAVAYTYVNGKKFYYASLEDAVADLASGSATLYILKNVELPQKLTISNRADLTLSPEEGESIVITGGDSVSTSFFSIPQGAKLTVQGDITYKSSDEKVATVDAATGEVIIVGAGTATITATAAEKGTKHEECTVCHFQKDPVEIPAKGTAGGDQNANGSGTNADASANGTKTGDAMPIGLLAVFMMAAAAGIAFCGRKLYKNR